MSWTLTQNGSSTSLDDPIAIAEVGVERIATYNFGGDDYVSHHSGRQTEQLIVTGIQYSSDVYTLMSEIKTMMDAAEEVTVTGLPDSNHNTTYRIAHLAKDRHEADYNCVRYTITLEKKQEGS